MKKILLSSALIWGAVALGAQTFVSSTYLGAKTKAQLVAQFGVPIIDFGANYYRIEYTTTDAQGQPDTVSGLLAIPNDPGKVYPRLVYQHGTSGSKLDVPSFNVNSSGEGIIGLLFAGLGYVSFLPDYLGLGVSDEFHPYVHAATEASAALDMLRATESFAAGNNIYYNDQLFVTGYSQGGHAAMALQRAIELENAAEFTVTASAPMSGPYSISGVMRDLILDTGIYYYPAYIPNTACSYQSVYGNIFSQMTDIFKEPYASEIEQFYNGATNLADLNEILIDLLIANEGECRPYHMVQPDALQAITDDPQHPVNLALADNDVYKWAPQAPTRLFYCMADDQVPFMNSIIARDTMQALGAVDMGIGDVNPGADHGGCVSPALINTVLFFSGFKQVTVSAPVAASATRTLIISPNPAVGKAQLQLPDAPGQLQLIDVSGGLRRSVEWGGGWYELDTADMPAGMYLARFTGKDGIWQQQFVIQN